MNPFSLMFDSTGTLWVADCHTKPFQVVLRGMSLSIFGRPHDGIGFYPKIMGHLHGSTAIGGVVKIDDPRSPEEFQQNLLCGNPVTSRVDRDSLEWHGSTPTAIEKPDFIASDDPWFRPVAFAFSPDGSIYVADFYNKIIGHYEVPLNHPGRDRTSGRIWRIVPPLKQTNSPAEQIRDFSTASVPQLITGLGHPNVYGQLLALNELTDRIGKDAIPAAREALPRATRTRRSGRCGHCSAWHNHAQGDQHRGQRWRAQHPRPRGPSDRRAQDDHAGPAAVARDDAEGQGSARAA